MKFRSVLPSTVALAIFASAAIPTAIYAQDSPKILEIVRENLKPGKDGASHEKTEAAFAAAMAAGKSTDYYIGMTSISGPPRALFFSAYESFADMEAKHKAIGAAQGAAMDRANLADGELLSEVSMAIFIRRDSLSTNTKALTPKARYIEVGSFTVKPGLEDTFEAAAKMYLDGMKKAVPEAHWSCYQSYYAKEQGTMYLFLTAVDSGEDLDKEMAAGPTFAKSMGDSAMKKLSELVASSTMSSMSNLFLLSPKISYPPPAFAADPFWKPKPVSAKKP